MSLLSKLNYIFVTCNFMLTLILSWMLWLKYRLDWKNLSTLVNPFLHWGIEILFSISLICLFLFLVCPIFILILIGAHCFFESLYLSILSGNKKLSEEKKRKEKICGGVGTSNDRTPKVKIDQFIESAIWMLKVWFNHFIKSGSEHQKLLHQKHDWKSKLSMAFSPMRLG